MQRYITPDVEYYMALKLFGGAKMSGGFARAFVETNRAKTWLNLQPDSERQTTLYIYIYIYIYIYLLSEITPSYLTCQKII